MNDSSNEALNQRAEAVMPTDINIRGRGFSGINAVPDEYAPSNSPLYIVSGEGSHITDTAGRTYIDYMCGYGSLILGHANPEVVEAITEAAAKGSSLGGNIPSEVELAELVTAAYPSVEKIRFVTSEERAVMSAIRMSRAFTKRTDIVKFAGCYHGQVDELLASSGSGFLTSGIPEGAGILPQTVSHTHVLQYNNIEALHYLFSHAGAKIACVIVEPIAANMGLVMPVDGFLQQLRSVTEKYGALLVFDEQTTAFRHSFGGVQGKTRSKPDLTIFGKILGGGLPLSAVGGRAEVMAFSSPGDKIRQSGTHSANPVAIASGLATLKILQKSPEIYTHVFSQAISLQASLLSAAQKKGIQIQVPLSGSMLSCFFSNNPVKNEADAIHSDHHLASEFHKQLLNKGIYFPLSPFEVTYMSASLSSEDVARTCDAISGAFASI